MNLLTTTGYKAIEDITPSDLLVAYSTIDGSLVYNNLITKQYLTAALNPSETDFTFYLINNTWTLYQDQSIWRGDNEVCHVSELQVGDIIYDDQDNNILVSSITITTSAGWWRLEISNDHSYIADDLMLHNASRFWVGGGASSNWNATANTNWGASSGGANNSSVPTSTDTTTFDGAAPNGNTICTISAAATCASISITSAYTSTITYNNTLTVSGNITLTTGVTLSGSSAMIVANTSTLTSNGKVVNIPMTFNTSITYTFVDDWNLSGLVTSAGGNINTFNWTNDCTFTGSISGNTLTVSAVSLGSLVVGQQIIAAAANGFTLCPVTITGLGTGTGSTGTYTISTSALTVIAGTSFNSSSHGRVFCSGGFTNTATLAGNSTIFIVGGTFSNNTTATSRRISMNFVLRPDLSNITVTSSINAIGLGANCLLAYVPSIFSVDVSNSLGLFLGAVTPIVLATGVIVWPIGITTGNVAYYLGTDIYTSGLTTLGGAIITGPYSWYTQGLTITTNTNLSPVNMVFNVGGGTWSGNFLLNCNNLTFSAATTTISGAVQTNCNSITATQPLITTGSTLTITGGIMPLNTSAATFNNITFTAGSTITLNSNLNTTGTLTLNGASIFNGIGGWNVGSLNYSTAGGVITLQSGNTYNINNFIGMTGTSASNITLQSSNAGNSAIFTLSTSGTQDVAYLSTIDINSSLGQTIWVYKSNSLTRTQNWNALPTTVVNQSYISIY